jgi:hypothetical protein
MRLANNPAEATAGLPLRFVSRHEPCAGLMDEMSIYSRALSASEIQDIYRAGAGSTLRKILKSPKDKGTY